MEEDRQESKSPFNPAPTAATTTALATTAATTTTAKSVVAGDPKAVLTPEEFRRLCYSPPLQGTQV